MRNTDDVDASARDAGSVVRALRMLSAFDGEKPDLGVSEIARKVGLPKSTAHRLLHSLEAEGFVRRLSGSRYVLGWKLFELGTRVQEQGGLQSVVIEELSRLVTRTSENAHLAILDGGAVLYLEKVESPRSLRMPSAVGQRVPAHCTALGKVLLASLPDQQVGLISKEHGLPAFTPATLTDFRALQDHLQMVRERGYAIDREEFEEGLLCIAAPIRNETNEVCAAVSISGPATRLDERIEDLAATVQECSEALSHKLGHAMAWLSNSGRGPESDRILG
jgi:DNA-binding IclR family transcriptional regulator